MLAHRRIAVLIAAALVTAGGLARGADDALLGRGVQRLFEVGWDGSVKSRKEADQVAAKIDELFPGDARGAYAATLVLIKQRRYADAAKRIDSIASVLKSDPEVRQTKVRLAMLTKDYPAALAAMDQLSQLLPAAPAADTKIEAGHLETARFLGRMFGYLEGPIEGAVAATTLSSAKEKVVPRLGESRKPAFEDGRRQVREIFSSLLVEKEETAAEEKAAAAEQQENLLRDLTEEKKGLDPKRDSLRSDREKLQADAKKELENLSEDERPLVMQIMQVRMQAILVRRQKAMAIGNMASAQALLQTQGNNRGGGGFQSNSSLNMQINQYSQLAAQYDFQLSILERRMYLLNTQRALMRRRTGQSQAGIAGQIADIEKELKDLDKREKKLDVQQSKNERPLPIVTRGVRLLENEIASFSTYDEFPLESEKDRVLGWFK